MRQEANPGHDSSTVCAVCQTAIEAHEAVTSCPECRAEYHEECWQENGGCAIYGCAQVPPTEHRDAIEIMPSFWGQENKPCPACGREILTAAVRCRHCGAMLVRGGPEDPQEFRKREGINERLPSLRRTIVLMFILCAIPCIAPLAVLFGLAWYFMNREAIKALPSLYTGLCKIALAVGVCQSVLMIVLVLLYGAVRNP